VRSFIDLTEPHELPPYGLLLPAHATYQCFPIPDHKLPLSAQHMRELQTAMERSMHAGPVVYVHCRAGIGRTGLAVGCYLREQGESADGAMAELNRLWQQNARAARWPSIPETDEQERYIREWMPHPLNVPDVTRDTGSHRLQGLPLERYRGCLMGLAIGDVMATAPEGGATGWSDETGLAICVAESLLARGSFDGRDQLDRFRAWAQDPAAAGAAPSAKLRPLVRDVLARAMWNRAQMVGSHDPAHQDASPLARCAAAALFAAGSPGLAGSLGADVARITHQAPLPVDACRLFTRMIAAALRGAARAELMAEAERTEGLPLRDELRLLAVDWNGPQVGRRKPPTGILGALDRAVRCFARTRDFPEGLQRALAASGPERDAVAAGFGALAGAYYGEAALPPALRARVANLERVGALAEQMFQRHGAAGGRLA
jgi:ADP-ribosyl-[dinitrogen reductase] hydrolase